MKALVIGDFQSVFSKTLENKLSKEDFDLIIGVGDYAGIKDFMPYVFKCLSEVRKGNPRPEPEDFFGKKKFKELLKRDNLAAKNILRKLNQFNKPVFLVFGNGDDEWYRYKFGKTKFSVKKSNRKFLENLKNLKDINYGNVRFKNINFIGFGGYMDIDSFFDKEEWSEADYGANHRRILRRKRSEKDLFKRLKKAKGRKIFIFHYPPKGVFDIIKGEKNNPMNGKSAGIGFFREAIKKYYPELVICGHMHEYRGIKRMGKSFVLNPGDAERGKYAIIEIPEDKNEKIKAKFKR